MSGREKKKKTKKQLSISLELKSQIGLDRILFYHLVDDNFLIFHKFVFHVFYLEGKIKYYKPRPISIPIINIIMIISVNKKQKITMKFDKKCCFSIFFLIPTIGFDGFAEMEKKISTSLRFNFFCLFVCMTF